MAAPRDLPWAEHEKVALLAELLKAAPVRSEVLMLLIAEYRLQPHWDEMALPTGRSLNSCKCAYDILASSQRDGYVHKGLPPLPPHLPLSASESSRKRSFPFDVVGQGRAIQPRPPVPHQQDTQPSQHGYPLSQPSPVEAPGKRKRGRPRKIDIQARQEEAAQRGEIYSPTKARKQSRPTLLSLGTAPGEGQQQQQQTEQQMEQQMEQLMEQQQQLEQQQMEQQIGRALAPQQATQKEKQPAQAQQQPSPSTGPSSAAVQSAGGQASSSGPSGMSLHAVLERRPSAAEGRLATTPQSEHQRPMPTFASASAMVGDSSIHRACDAPGQESVRATTRDVPALPFAASPQSAPPALSHAGHRANAAGTSWIAFKDSGRDADPQHPSRS